MEAGSEPRGFATELDDAHDTVVRDRHEVSVWRPVRSVDVQRIWACHDVVRVAAMFVDAHEAHQILAVALTLNEKTAVGRDAQFVDVLSEHRDVRGGERAPEGEDNGRVVISESEQATVLEPR
jgi:hypothetical protein